MPKTKVVVKKKSKSKKPLQLAVLGRGVPRKPFFIEGSASHPIVISDDELPQRSEREMIAAEALLQLQSEKRALQKKINAIVRSLEKSKSSLRKSKSKK